jgi:hypothetical protein
MSFQITPGFIIFLGLYDFPRALARGKKKLKSPHMGRAFEY